MSTPEGKIKSSKTLDQIMDETGIVPAVGAILDDPERLRGGARAGNPNFFQVDLTPDHRSVKVTGEQGSYFEAREHVWPDDRGLDPNRKIQSLTVLADFGGARAQVRLVDGRVTLADYKDDIVSGLVDAGGEPQPDTLEQAIATIQLAVEDLVS